MVNIKRCCELSLKVGGGTSAARRMLGPTPLYLAFQMTVLAPPSNIPFTTGEAVVYGILPGYASPFTMFSLFLAQYVDFDPPQQRNCSKSASRGRKESGLQPEKSESPRSHEAEPVLSTSIMLDTPRSYEALERCADLWFSDCGLIVRAGNTLFRLSGQMLSARSPVFADMLSFPQPEDAEKIEGCPVVCLPDSPHDLSVFFRALFDHE